MSVKLNLLFDKEIMKVFILHNC